MRYPAATTVTILLLLAGSQPAVAQEEFTPEEGAAIAEMQQDLERLMWAQESHFADSVRYTADLAAIFEPSPNVEIVMVASDDAWVGRATHREMAIDCIFYIGVITPVWEEEEKPICKRWPDRLR